MVGPDLRTFSSIYKNLRYFLESKQFSFFLMHHFINSDLYAKKEFQFYLGYIIFSYS